MRIRREKNNKYKLKIYYAVNDREQNIFFGQTVARVSEDFVNAGVTLNCI